jgi:hypothetical protein
MKSLTIPSALRGAMVLAGGAAALMLAASGASAATDHVARPHGGHLAKGHEHPLDRGMGRHEGMHHRTRHISRHHERHLTHHTGILRLVRGHHR